jgi:hypothetical protein
MFKNILSVILAVVVAYIVLQLIGFAFVIAIKLIKLLIVACIAIPAYFFIKKQLGDKN